MKPSKGLTSPLKGGAGFAAMEKRLAGAKQNKPMKPPMMRPRTSMGK